MLPPAVSARRSSSWQAATLATWMTFALTRSTTSLDWMWGRIEFGMRGKRHEPDDGPSVEGDEIDGTLYESFIWLLYLLSTTLDNSTLIQKAHRVSSGVQTKGQPSRKRVIAPYHPSAHTIPARLVSTRTPLQRPYNPLNSWTFHPRSDSIRRSQEVWRAITR